MFQDASQRTKISTRTIVYRVSSLPSQLIDYAEEPCAGGRPCLFADIDQAIEEAVKGELPKFVSRDGNLRPAPEADSELVANDIMSLLQRVADTSMKDIDRLISELQTLREILQEQGARARRELAEYAQLSQSAMESTKTIAKSLAGWRSPYPVRD